MMFKRVLKITTIIFVFITIIIFLCIKYETIDLVTDIKNINEISSPFEKMNNNKREIRSIVSSLDKVILREDAPEQTTREVMYQIHIQSKNGHTEEIISYGERLLHYYNGQCLGEYYVPLISQIYLYFIYGSVRQTF